MRSSRGRASLTSARCGTSRPASSWKETSRERVNCLADHLHPQCLCRRRGDLQGVLDAAHAVDVGRERDPRDHPARRDPGHRLRRVQPRARGGPGRGGAGEREHGRRVPGDRPNAADVCPQEETRADEVPRTSRLRGGQTLQREDETHRRQQVDELCPDRSRRHDWPPSCSTFAGAGFFLRTNICSIRSVTKNPPTMFTLASTTATRPTTSARLDSAYPVTRIAPSRMIPWIAFAPDINGVCSVEDTLEITSTPTKTLRMKMVSQTIDSFTTGLLPRGCGSARAIPCARE